MAAVGERLRWARDLLSPSLTASLDAQLLMGHILGKPRAWVLAHTEDSLTEEERRRFEDLVSRRSTGEPIAYLRGWVEWRDMELEITPDVLVPRPETELLVDKATEIASEISVRSLADIGTGSGAIAIAVARTLPNIEVFATDLSEEALSLARRNAEKQGVAERMTFFKGNLIEPLSTEPNLLAANLPYLSTEMMSVLDAPVRHEPDPALRAGATGLELYEALFRQMCERGWTAPLLLEIDPRQSTHIRELVEKCFSCARVEIFKDLAGLDRAVVVRS